MKFNLIIICILSSLFAVAQEDSTKAPFLQFPFIPQFKIFKAPDSSAYTREDLPSKKPVILMIFSPECDHCKHQIENMLKQKQKLEKYQIVMTTWLPFDAMVKFYNELKIADHPNIVMGRDTKFFFPVHYKLRGLPGIYLYDKKHRLMKNFENTVTVDKLIE
jgi:thioredoxin-related protein